MSSDSPVSWFDDFLGVGYRYYEIRMTVTPLFSDLKKAQIFWRETVHWWNDHSIKIRFVETGDTYWFIMGAESRHRLKIIDFFSKFFQNPLTMSALKKGMKAAHIYDWVRIQKKFKEDVKKRCKM